MNKQSKNNTKKKHNFIVNILLSRPANVSISGVGHPNRLISKASNCNMDISLGPRYFHSAFSFACHFTSLRVILRCLSPDCMLLTFNVSHTPFLVLRAPVRDISSARNGTLLWAHKIAFIAMSKHKNLFLSTTHRMADDQHQTQSTDLLAADNGLFVNVLPVQFLYCLVGRVMGFLTATQHKHLTQQKRRLNVIEYEKKAINFYVWAMNFEVPLGPGRFGWAKNRSQSQNRRVVRLVPRWAIVTKSYGVAISPRGGSSH